MSHVAGKFVYSDYWGKWSLILYVDGAFVTEMDVTPINPQFDGSWCGMRDRRTHCTALGKRDKLTDELPADVREKVRSRLGGDFLKYVDKAQQDAKAGAVRAGYSYSCVISPV